MARPDLLRHRKFRRLVSLLRLPEPYALGHLEWLWHLCYETGDPFLGDSTDVELAAMWRGEPGVFTKALLQAGGEGAAGFIEPAPGGGYQVHDLLENAPTYVKDRFRKRLERTGTTRAERKPLKETPGLVQDRSGSHQDSGGQDPESQGIVQDNPGGVPAGPGIGGTRPAWSAPSLSPYPDTQEHLESEIVLETPARACEASPGFDGGRGEDKDSDSGPFPRPGSKRERGFRPVSALAARFLGGISGPPDPVAQFVEGQAWMQGDGNPHGLTRKQVRTLLAHGLTIQAAQEAWGRFSFMAETGTIKTSPGALAYRLLEDRLDGEQARGIRETTRTAQEQFRRRETTGEVT